LAKRATDNSAVLYDGESVTSEPARLLGLVSPSWCGAHESMRITLGIGALPPQISAGDMEHGIHVQLAVVLPDF